MLEYIIFGNSVRDYLVSLAVFAAYVFLLEVLLRAFLMPRFRRFAQKTAHDFDDVLLRVFEKSVLPLLFAGAFYLSIKNLSIRPSVMKTIEVAGIFLLTYFGIRLVTAIFRYWFESRWVLKEQDEAKRRNLMLLVPLMNGVLWVIGFVFLLDNLGFDIATIVAGLGIGGIAVAFASQAILADLFSYFSILLDRPFEIGDFILVGDFMGNVEHIGVKTTRVRSLSGEQLVFSNNDLTSSRVRNFKRMETRRIAFTFGVVYGTPTAQLAEIPVLVEKIVRGIGDVSFDRAHFSSFGDFSLNFEVVYYLQSADYRKYMDVQQEINLALKEEFERRGIEFAFPTSTVYLNRAGDAGGPKRAS